MDPRTNRHAELWLVIAAVGGTALFAPAAMARIADEYTLAEALRKSTDTPAEENDEPRELLAVQQHLNWDRSVSRISKPFSTKRMTAFSWRVSIRDSGSRGYEPFRSPQSDRQALRQAVLKTLWPHAPPLQF